MKFSLTSIINDKVASIEEIEIGSPTELYDVDALSDTIWEKMPTEVGSSLIIIRSK